MRRSSGVAIAVAVGTVAVVAPILISIQLAWNEAMSNQQDKVRNYASDIILRGEEAGNQLNNAHRLLNAAHYPACSPQEVALMQQLDVTSNYIQAISRIEGNQITCTSLGTTQPVEIGPADVIAEDGAEERFNVWMFKAQNHPLLVVSKDGFAFVVDTSLVEDLPSAVPGVSVGVFVPSKASHNLISTANGKIDSAWLKDVPKGTSTTYLDGGYIVSVVRAQQSDIAAVAAFPSIYVRRQLRPFAFIFVPFGLLCAAGLAWAVAQISRNRLSLPYAIRNAAKRKEFFVLYQPIIDLSNRRCVGAEALVRWRRGGSIVPPDSFIPEAEKSGVITLITACVAEIVAADLPSMLDIDRDFYVSMNLSGPDLLSRKTVPMLRSIISDGHARPCNLQVEATERHFLQSDDVRDLIAVIRSIGIGVAIDDFGTGYSSLSCLQTLGLDSLKIDKAFVETIDTDGATSQVVPHIIYMAHSLGLVMVAEGVETEAQALFLHKRGVHYAQGYRFAKPMNVASLRASLRHQTNQVVERPEVLA
jgi:sensor c-di-GMP phosphodiesterase-like protein